MANKSIKDAFQRFWQHCVLSFATKEYVDNAVGSGGGNTGGGGGASVELDKTLTKEGYAADAKAVGDALANVGNGGGGASGGNVEVYVFFSGMPVALGEFMLAAMEINCNVITAVVQELPTTVTPSTLVDGGTIYLYVVESTGVVYGDIGAGATTLGMSVFQAEGFDRGWTNNLDAVTEQGIYCVRESGVQIIDVISTKFSTATMEKIRKNFVNTVLRVSIQDVFFYILKPAMIENGRYIYTTVELSLGGNYYSAKIDGETGAVYLTHGTIDHKET